jgi:ankyrin repeat protein
MAVPNGGDAFISRCTPLHVAAQIIWPNDGTLIAHLCEMAPESATLKDARGDLPLHVACEVGNIPAVDTLLEVYPKGNEEPNNDTFLPIHNACYNGVCLRQVLQAYPKVVKAKTQDSGELPLHTML